MRFPRATRHEPVTRVVDLDFFDLHVVGDLGVAALTGQGRGDLVGPATEFLADDVVPAAALQVAAVVGRGEAAVGDPDDAGQAPTAHVVFHLADELGVAGVAGPRPHPHRDAGAGDGQADDDLGQVVAVVLALAVGTEPDVAHVVGGGGLGVDLAALVTGGWGVSLTSFEICRCRVEEQQVHFEVEQVGDLVVDLLGQGVLDGQQGVHRPVTGVVTDLGQVGDVHVVADPVGGGELAGRLQRPVGDQREQDPLHPLAVDPALGQGGADRGGDAQALPQPVEQAGAAVRAGVGEGHVGRAGQGCGRRRVQQSGQRLDETLDAGAIQLVLTTEGVQHLGAGDPGGRVPLVVSQLEVAHDLAGLVLP